MNGNRVNKKEIARVILAMVIVLSVAGAALAVFNLWEKRSQERALSVEDEDPVNPYENEEIRPTVRIGGKSYALREGLESFLIMGLDVFEGVPRGENLLVNGQQADFLLLVVVDSRAGTYEALHINRDSLAEVKKLSYNGAVMGTETVQLALAHAYGSGGKDSCRNQVEAVSGFLYGVPIDHYVAVTMDAVGVLTDLVEGVTLVPLEDIPGTEPPVKKGEEITLTSANALEYVRGRMSVADGTNLNRMERQRQFIAALAEKLREAEAKDKNFSLTAVLEISKYLVSDLTADQLSAFSDVLAQYPAVEIRTIAGEASVGETYMEFRPDETALRQQIIELYYEPVEE